MTAVNEVATIILKLSAAVLLLMITYKIYSSGWPAMAPGLFGFETGRPMTAEEEAIAAREYEEAMKRGEVPMPTPTPVVQ
jgi:hypothetical protein